MSICNPKSFKHADNKAKYLNEYVLQDSSAPFSAAGFGINFRQINE